MEENIKNETINKEQIVQADNKIVTQKQSISNLFPFYQFSLYSVF